MVVGLGPLIVGAAVFAAVFFHDRTALTTAPTRWQPTAASQPRLPVPGPHRGLIRRLDPFSLRATDSPEFLRRISYAWPLLLGLALPLFPRLRRLPHVLPIAGAVMLVSAFAYLTATAEEVCAFGYFTAVPEDGCANLGHGSLLRDDTYLLWTDLVRARN